jgi:arylsulfatase A-like enzyme
MMSGILTPFYSVLLIAALLLSSVVGLRATTPSKPNIILIFADDLGWKDVGYQGTDFYETPNIDRLAKEGMVFTAGYAGGANCMPSRACLLSGQYTPRHGVYAVGNTKRGPVESMRMKPIPNTDSLASENVTVAEAMKAAGYATGHFGKWHVGGKDGDTSPSAQGFDVTMEKNGKGGGVADDPKAVYAITQAACLFMEENKERPFFAYVAHHAIHSALQSRQSSLDKFKAKKPGEQHKDPLYAGCTYDLDDAIGILLAKLRELGIDQRTMIVFTSDNGATGGSLQEPLRGNKGSYHEGGIREPFIVRWPGVVKPGSRCDVPVINLDLYPTFLTAAGAAVPKDKILDGESLLPLLRSEGALKRASIFWHFPGYLDNPVTRGRDPVFRTRPVTVINHDHWKLYLYHEEWQLDGGRAALATNNAVELYNLREDIGERKNLAKDNIEKRDALLDELLAWMAHTKAKLPTERNETYAPEASLPGKKKKRVKDKSDE